jgi:hypothetical protein
MGACDSRNASKRLGASGSRNASKSMGASGSRNASKSMVLVVAGMPANNGGQQQQECLKTNKNKFLFEPKQTETRSVSRLFRFVSWNQKLKISVCFGVSNLY